MCDRCFGKKGGLVAFGMVGQAINRAIKAECLCTCGEELLVSGFPYKTCTECRHRVRA